MSISVTPFVRLADVTAAHSVMQSFVTPLMVTLGGLATLVCTFFLVMSGIQYMTSKGSPEKLEHAKRIMRNALIGLVIVLAAGTLTAILSHAYGSTGGAGIQNIPSLNALDTKEPGPGIVDILIKAIVGLFKHIIESAAAPFIKALDFFTHSTALMAQNPSVFKLWLTVAGIADALFVVAVALMGFHVMSAASLGLDELDFKHLIPRLSLTFLLLNTSIFAIDAIISLSNVMIRALEAAFSSVSVWDVLSKIVSGADGLGLVALLIMIVFTILSVILLVYYVMRLVTLYIGAVLSPLIILLAVLPGFKDFAVTAVKTYLTTIFVLFVHVIILQLAASLFAGAITNSPGAEPNTLMAMIIGIATLITLLKTQGVMMQMSYVSTGPRALRKLGDQFMTSVSYTTNIYKTLKPKPSRKPKEEEEGTPA
jgi:Type IV secretion system pilin/TrbL/VirB6 plasmid conjugal transfer protein